MKAKGEASLEEVREFAGLLRAYLYRQNYYFWDDLTEPSDAAGIAGKHRVSKGFGRDLRVAVDDQLVEAQIRNEKMALKKALAEHQSWVDALERTNRVTVVERNRLMVDAFQALREKIKEDMQPGRPGQPNLIRKRFGMLDPDVVAITAFHRAFTAAEDGLRQQSAAIGIAKALDRELALEKVKSEDPTAFKEMERAAGNGKPGQAEKRIKQAVQTILDKEDEDPELDLVRCTVGNQLLFHVKEQTGLITIDTDERACIVRLSEIAKLSLEVLRNDAAALVRAEGWPMIAPPLDWTGRTDGGYFTTQMPCIKVRRSTSWSRNYCDNFENKPPTDVLDALNHLQKTRYVVSTIILNNTYSIFQELKDVSVGVEPDDEEAAAVSTKAEAVEDLIDSDVTDQIDGLFKRPDVDDLWSWEIISQALTGAAAYRELEAPFYFPWQLDFRGRAYPVARSPSPQGSDIALSLLPFASDGPLTDSGRRWLALHGANVLGIGSKLESDTLENRVAWIESHSDDILAVTNNPAKHLEFWSGSTGRLRDFRKTAWRALAFCIAWRQQKNNLPVAVDGTCNAIQHLAALTGDISLARETNLVALDARQDIYGTIASELKAALASDSDSEGFTMFRNMVATLGVTDPLAIIDRGLCKQPVMTSPYGVTPRGVRQALSAEFRRRYGGRDSKLKTIDQRHKVYFYLGTMLDQTVRKHLAPAEALKTWMQEAASRIARLNQPVTWRTPLGLTVSQAYPVFKGERIKTNLTRLTKGSKSSDLWMLVPTDDIDVKSSRNGIVANFVHSLDATHMLMTTLAAKRAGIEHLRMVHDSYATTPNEMEILSRILREEFIALYSSYNPVADFAESCSKVLVEHGEGPLTDPPARGPLDITEVARSTYFFC